MCDQCVSSLFHNVIFIHFTEFIAAASGILFHVVQLEKMHMVAVKLTVQGPMKLRTPPSVMLIS